MFVEVPQYITGLGMLNLVIKAKVSTKNRCKFVTCVLNTKIKYILAFFHRWIFRPAKRALLIQT